MPNKNSSRPALLVFSDDWGRHPSSCQHLVRQLLPRYQVCWVNTIGTRPPSFDLATLKRGWEKIRQWSRPSVGPEKLPKNLRVLTPKMWPWFRSTLDRRLNRELLNRQLATSIQSLGPDVIGLTTVPIVADLVGLLPVRRWVYYCVDDFGEWPGLDQQAMQRMDNDLIRGADAIVAVSEKLQERLARLGRTASLLTHGVDLDFWQSGSPVALPRLEDVERPLVIFWGVLDRRMDVAIVKRLATDLDHGTIVLVGPESDPDPELAAMPGVLRLGSLPFDSLPHVARLADVLIMPYADLPVTRAMQPLKLKEYLATGKPAVVRDLPATRPWADSADLADSPEAFSRAVRLRIQTGLPANQAQARTCLEQESWGEKAAFLEKTILNLGRNDAWMRDSEKSWSLRELSGGCLKDPFKTVPDPLTYHPGANYQKV